MKPELLGLLLIAAATRGNCRPPESDDFAHFVPGLFQTDVEFVASHDIGDHLKIWFVSTSDQQIEFAITTRDGSYRLAGELEDSSGGSINPRVLEATRAYELSAHARELASWRIEAGEQEATIIFDPLCPECITQCLDLLAKGISINVVPVALLAEESERIAAHLLMSPTHASSLRALLDSEHLAEIQSAPETAINSVRQNTEQLGIHGIFAVPLVILHPSTGLPYARRALDQTEYATGSQPGDAHLAAVAETPASLSDGDVMANSVVNAEHSDGGFEKSAERIGRLVGLERASPPLSAMEKLNSDSARDGE